MKDYKKPKSGHINKELEEYKRKRNEKLAKTPSFVVGMYKKERIK